jgi:hypothetical protein
MHQSGGLVLAAKRQHNYCRPFPDGNANELRRVTKNSTTQTGGGVFAAIDEIV